MQSPGLSSITSSELSPTLRRDVPPVDDASGEELHCPLCGYNLRGLTEPRCPECGFRFEWAELRDPARQLHPYLFEHHPERNAWSFGRTLRAGLRPRRFWSTLYPTQPSRKGRLIAYWALAASPLLLIGVAHLYFIARNIMAQWWAWRRTMPPPQILIHETFDTDAGSMGFGMLSLAFVAWPWATLLALMVFQASMRRARVRMVHVLRCVLYASDLTLWLAVPTALAVVFYWRGGGPLRGWRPALSDPVTLTAGILPPLAWLALTWRLGAAYRRYLNFDHPLLTVLCSQLIIVLAYWKVAMVAKGL